MICNTVMRNICMKRKKGGKTICSCSYYAMNLLNLHLRMTTYFMHCLVHVALGFCQLELWQQSLHMEIGRFLTNDVFLYLPPLLYPDDGHKWRMSGSVIWLKQMNNWIKSVYWIAVSGTLWRIFVCRESPTLCLWRHIQETAFAHKYVKYCILVSVLFGLWVGLY